MTKTQNIGMALAILSLALYIILADVATYPISVLKLMLAPWFACGIMMLIWK